MITDQDLSDEYILPCQAQLENTIIVSGDPNAKGLIVYHDTKQENFFFIVQIQYQKDSTLINLEHAAIPYLHKKHLLDKLGPNFKGLWLKEDYFNWQTLQPELFPFYVPEHLSLHQMIMQLHKEVK